MNTDTLLQELPSHPDIEVFRRSSRPSDPYTAAARSVHSVMSQLERMFDPCNNRVLSLQNVLFVSLDLQYDDQGIHQIGVSTLDVNGMSQIDSDRPRSMAPTVSNDVYLLQCNRIQANKCQYRYGEPRLAKGWTPEEVLSPVLERGDASCQPRNIVLIGHEIHQDILRLQCCGFDVTRIPNLISLIDLAPIASYFLNDSTNKLSLGQLCQRLGIRTCGVRNAGHRALYTLQALLSLFCRYKLQKLQATHLWANILPEESVLRSDEEHTRLWQCQIDAIRFIADEVGNVLWTGSPKQRKRRETFTKYMQTLADSVCS